MLRNRLKWFLFYRLVIAILGLGAILIYHLGFQPFSQRPAQPLFPTHILLTYGALVFACLINLVYLLLIKYFTPPHDMPKPGFEDPDEPVLRRLALIQISVDIFLETFLAYFTGGSGSIFVILYFSSILAANIMVSPRSGLFFASLSSILLSIITIMYSLGAAGQFVLPLLPPDFVKSSAQGFRFILPYLFFFILILHFVAYSAGRLVNELAHERRLRNELKKHTEMLEILREMSIGIAHELRNPLAAIRGSVQELARTPLSQHAPVGKENSRLIMAADNQKLINTVLKETDRLNKIISDFLDFARERPPLVQPVNLTEIIQEVVSLLKQSLHAPTGKVGDIFSVIIDTLANIRCKIDPAQIKQVLYNLIQNAIDASSPGGQISVRAFISSHDPYLLISHRQNNGLAPKSYAIIEIIDYGKSIPPEHLQKIFEPFFTTKPQGVGLGLAIAHRIIRAHHGELTVESPVPPGKSGAKFTISLPQN